MSVLTQVSNFGNNAGEVPLCIPFTLLHLGLKRVLVAVEKTLRLAQSFTMIGGSLQETVQAAAPYVLARGQFNICEFYLPPDLFCNVPIMDDMVTR